ncbi:MAG: hypothetical protein PHX87_02200 [Candidatus Peribacteraceae bacterium]|nr:hypothetical protein [Candidatus Peribacteraceae bacterium]MDD5742219.1 hypothetical protein [Candidatus Peribacteraceae bacterium]
MDPENHTPDDEPVTHTVVHPGDVFRFRCDRKGEEKLVTVEEAEWIGEGSFGVIYAVRCRIRQLIEGTPSPEPSETCRRVIKSFILRGDALPAKRKHDLLKRTGLPVFADYDLNEAQEMVLMPDGNEGGRLTVSQNKSCAREALELQPLLSITNFSEMLEHLRTIVRHATLFGISVPFDAYFFFVQRKDQDGSATCSLDDSDNVEGGNSDMGLHLVMENIRGVTEALNSFIAYAVAEPERGKYLHTIQGHFTTLRQELQDEMTRIQDV